MIKDIIIYGTGNLAREVIELIHNINKVKYQWNILGAISIGPIDIISVHDIPILGDDTWIKNYNKELYAICAMSNSNYRKSNYDKLQQFDNIKFATLVDPSVYIASNVEIDEGSIISYGVKLLINTKIGKGVLINVGSIIGHDAIIHNYSTLLLNVIVAGHVIINENVEIGSGTFLYQDITIGNNITIAPLSSVLKSINTPGIYSGNPARQIR